MQVAVMGRSIRPQATGVGRYAANLVDALASLLPPHSLTVFLTHDSPSHWDADVRQVRAPFRTPNEYARALWEQSVVPAQVAHLDVDVYHSPNYILPLALSRPSVVTIHDVAFRDHSLHRLTSHLYLTVLTGLALARAQRVVAVSEYTRRAIEAHYPHTLGRVDVIYQGVDPTLRVPSPDQVRAFRTRLGLTYPYVLYVGTLEPRKNLTRVVAAFERAVQQAGLPHHLVLAGARGWRLHALDAAIERSPLRDRIHRPGYVAGDDLGCWYTGADVFVFPSLIEGFGRPPLEAMSCGVPVITSTTSALPEVVGEAALKVDPRNVADLTTALVRVLTDPTCAEALRAAGPRRAASFSWAETARRYVAVYARAVHEGHR